MTPDLEALGLPEYDLGVGELLADALALVERHRPEQRDLTPAQMAELNPAAAAAVERWGGVRLALTLATVLGEYTTNRPDTPERSRRVAAALAMAGNAARTAGMDSDTFRRAIATNDQRLRAAAATQPEALVTGLAWAAAMLSPYRRPLVRRRFRAAAVVAALFIGAGAAVLTVTWCGTPWWGGIIAGAALVYPVRLSVLHGVRLALTSSERQARR